MFLWDSNIIIYATVPAHQFLREMIEVSTPYVSVISKMEVLGYHKLSANEKQMLELFFKDAPIVSLNDEIIKKPFRSGKVKNYILQMR